MRVLPSKLRAQIRALNRSVQQLQHQLTIERTLLIVEAAIFTGAVLYLLTGGRGVIIDAGGRRADTLLLALTVGLFVTVHLVINRRLVALIERRIVPVKYDERQLLFDLDQEARSARNLDQLYKSIVDRVRDAFRTENVCIFVRDDNSGDFVCRIIEPCPQTLLTGADPDSAVSSDHAGLKLSREAFVVKRLRHLAIPMTIEQQDLDVWVRALRDAPIKVREARTEECETLKQISTSLLLQIMIKEQLVGILSLGPRRINPVFSTAERELLVSIAGQLAFVIENSKLVERMVAEERLRRELELATEVQQRLFPPSSLLSHSYELSGYCLPARGVGGDYYDFIELENGDIGVAIADVAGKGISAALLMSIVQASLRSQAIVQTRAFSVDSPLAEIASAMNRLLWKSTGASSYATFFYAQLDSSARKLSYVNAGHNPPLLFRKEASVVETDHSESLQGDLMPSEAANGGRIAARARVNAIANGRSAALALETPPNISEPLTLLSAGGPVLGVFEECTYEQATIDVTSGDLLVAYTDGVTEALNEHGEEFGETRLKETIAGLSWLSAEWVREGLLERLRRWCGNAPQHDDLTFLVLKVR
jgi:sigma-B regulation protein RsbU (phosphoserine phosphatase)